MKVFKIVLLNGFAALMLFGCGASQKIKESNSALDQLMANKSFEIDIRTAEPQLTQAMGQIANSGLLGPGNSVSRIDVNGSGYFIRIEGDSVAAELPYYGEQQMGGGYTSNTGIKFNGITEDLEIIKDEMKQGYTIKFTIGASAETFFVATTVGNNATSSTAVRSSNRNRIRYAGKVGPLEALEK